MFLLLPRKNSSCLILEQQNYTTLPKDFDLFVNYFFSELMCWVFLGFLLALQLCIYHLFVWILLSFLCSLFFILYSSFSQQLGIKVKCTENQFGSSSI